MSEGNGTDSTNTHCIPHCLALAWPTLIKNLLGDVININYLKSQHLSMWLFNILCDEKWSTHKTLLLNTEVDSPGKETCMSFGIVNWTSYFSMEHHVYLKDQLTGKLWFFGLNYLKDVFWKSTKWAGHFKENEVQYLLPKKNLNFYMKIRILKRSYMWLWAWELPKT